MKKSFLKYYDDEYEFLVEAGKEFNKNQPKRGKYLGITNEVKDPYIERLFEGFAFLTARLRQRLDAELPEFTEGVMGLLWPHYLRPIPALSMLKFTPKEGKLREPLLIERGAEVLSNPIGAQAYVCKFRTCWNVRLLPLALDKVSLETNRYGRHEIKFRFRLTPGAKYENIFPLSKSGAGANAEENRIRLFLNSDPPMTASLLLLYLTYYAEKATLLPVAGEAEQRVAIAPAGFAEEENLWPASPQTLSGYRLLQEYFAFPQKFSFIDMIGLNRCQLPAGTGAFEIQVLLKKNFPEGHRFGAENFDLFCTPIINLYAEDIRPISLNFLRPEYPVTPQADHAEVYAIEEVIGFENKTRKKHPYLPFNSFRHAAANGHANGEAPRFYKASSRFDPNGKWESVLSFGGHELQDGQLPQETVTISATCMNGAVPKELRQRSICNRSQNFKHDVPFYNLSQPTPPIYPPPEDGLQWRLLSHMSLNFLSLTDIGALKELLSLYNWKRDEFMQQVNRSRIDGIREIKPEPDQHAIKNNLIRGTGIKMTLDETKFTDRGDLYLFGCILKELLAHFATINSFVRLSIVTDPNGETFTWPPSLDKGVPII